MKRFFLVFKLTVAEQRVIIVLLVIIMAFAFWKTQRHDQIPSSEARNGYNPGMRP